MRRSSLAAIGLLLLVGAGCRSSVADVTSTEVIAPVEASTTLWGEVPKQCA